MKIKEEEIELVKNNIKIFDEKITYEELFLDVKNREKLHGLFFILCNTKIFPLFKEAIDLIKNHKDYFFSKMVSKIKKAKEYSDQQDVIAEIFVLGYFLKKFVGNNLKIQLERKTNGNRNVDISLLGLFDLPINIDVMALHDCKYIEGQRKEQKGNTIIFWQTTTRYDKTILSRIVDKLDKGQFPKNEYNFVWIFNFSIADNIDFEESIRGTEKGIEMKNGKIIERYSNKDGLADVINQNNYSPIYGILYSKWDTKSHKLIKVIQDCPDNVYKVID